jgi:hypothetical protein
MLNRSAPEHTNMQRLCLLEFIATDINDLHWSALWECIASFFECRVAVQRRLAPFINEE